MKQQLAINDRWIEKILLDWRYSAKQDGTLWTRLSVNGAGLMKGGKWRRCGKIDPSGYNIFTPKFNGKKTNIKIHRVIFAAFKGKLEMDKVINHKDGNRLNNTPPNLEQTTWTYNNKYRSKK